MITVTTDEQLYESKYMPNFVVWEWMRTGLKLSGLSIMLFALIFSQSFDENHACNITLTAMERWFGVTRQTLSRNIEKLPCIKKGISKRNTEGELSYSHNYYYVDMPAIMKICEKVGDTVYDDFMQAYEQILILKFPNDKTQIESYFKQIKSWHNEGNETTEQTTVERAVVRLANSVNIDNTQYDGHTFMSAMGDISNKLDGILSWVKRSVNEVTVPNPIIIPPDITSSSSSPPTNNPQTSLSTETQFSNYVADATVNINNINTDNSVNADSYRENTQTPTNPNTQQPNNPTTKTPTNPNTQAVEKERKPGRLSGKQLAEACAPKPKKRKTKEKKEAEKNKMIDICMKMTSDFVNTYYEGDEELLTVLNKFLMFKFEKPFTVDRWDTQLNILRKVKYELTELISKVEASYTSGYAMVGYDAAERIAKDKNATMRTKSIARAVDEFLNKDGNKCSDKLAEAVKEYCNDFIATQTELKASQVSAILHTLDDYSEEEQIKLIKAAYSHGWKSFVFNNNNNYGNNTVNKAPTDMKEKEKLIDKFIYDNYLFLWDGLKSLLLDYIQNTSNGSSMTAKTFESKLNSFALHCVTSGSAITSLKDAVANNYPNLCREDFDDTKKANEVFGGLEKRKIAMLNSRKLDCSNAYKNNKNDSRFNGVDESYIIVELCEDKNANKSDELKAKEEQVRLRFKMFNKN